MRNTAKNRERASHPAKEPGSRTGRRKFWFRAGALLGIPLLFLLLAEALLRAGGYGYPASFFLRRQVNGREVLVDNQQFGKRFFPAGLVRYPRPMTLPLRKGNGTVRIFVLGESAAMGDPDAKFGMPRMLEVLLRERFPKSKFEVVNAAMVAINSHVVLPIARECARHEGDLWVVYMGNNEVIGPFGSISMFGARTPGAGLIRTSLALRRTRLGQLLDSSVRWLQGPGRPAAEWAGMTMWAGQGLRESDPRTERVYRNLKSNLAGIVEAGRRAEVPILLCTVANNLKDCAPFGSLHKPELTASELGKWDKEYQDGIALEAKGKLAEACSRYERAAALDDTFADLAFRRARCLLGLGHLAEAQQLFRRARDQDALEFRANGRMNDLVRECAASYAGRGVQLLDVDELFAAKSPQGLAGFEYFYEHVHLNPEGNYLLARAVAERASAMLGLKEPRDWLSEQRCLEALGFTEWNRHDILVRILERAEEAPFTQQVNHAEHLQTLHRQIEQCRLATKPAQLQRAARQVAQAVARWPEDADLRWNLAQLLDVSDQTREAEDAWRTVSRLLPQGNLPYYNLGRLLESHGRQAEALHCYEQSVQANPDYFDAQCSLGLLLNRLGEPSKAILHLRRAVQEKPSSADVHLALGLACQQTGRTAEAERQFREVLRLDPNNQQARQSLGELKPWINGHQP